MKDQILIIISRYKEWLLRPYIETPFWKNKLEWESEIKSKVEELKLKLTK